jgi:phytoene desaturase
VITYLDIVAGVYFPSRTGREARPPVKDVVVERFVDPEDWAASDLERGTPFALAHRFFQSRPFRPRNVDPRVPGCVLVRMGTVPGVGIPMAVTSGRLAADRVEAWGGR